MDNLNLSRFSLVSQFSETPAKGAEAWNTNIEGFLFERLAKTPQVTIAGQPGYGDRPWWWGCAESSQ